MKNLNNENINTPDYWDNIYISEWGSGKRRIDNERLEFLVGSMKDWMQKNPSSGSGSFLDVGCGNGEMMRLLHAELPEWKKFGIDITPKIINKISQVDPHFNYKVASIYDIPYGDNTFQIVFCGETLEHLEFPELAVEKLMRVVAPGGYLVCSIPLNHNNYSPEHLNEFTIWDAINLTTKGDIAKLVNLDVKCGGLSTIWATKKE